MPTILIAEDHSVVRMGTAMLIREQYPDAVIREAETFDEVVEVLAREPLDLLLLDIHIPGGDNLQMVEAVKLRQPELPILIFSAYDEQLYAIRYLKSGAQGYLKKTAPPDEIKTAIRKVLSGEKYISKIVQEQLVEQLLDPSKKQEGLSSLSNREVEVMQLLVKGASPAEIKSTLNIHDSTISTYKAKIFEKLNVTNVIELAEKVRLMDPLKMKK
ncbi:response regulator transcription factor [Nostoc ellipsosporum NOK]|nr:response regulator transcription factor [Nostoc ellipsosporum NOK]